MLQSGDLNERKSQSKALSTILNEYNRVYLRIFNEKVPKYGMACLFYTFLHVVLGLLMGYFRTLYIILMSEKASFSELQTFTYTRYPKLLKPFFGPLMDKYYLHSFGRSRTYIALSNLSIIIIFTVASFYMDRLIAQREFNTISYIFILVELVDNILLVGTSVWILTLFRFEDRANASFLKPTGMLLGEFISYNLFVPLNGLKNDDGERVVMHSDLCWTVVIVTSVSLIVVVFLIAEKRIVGAGNTQLCKIVSSIPKIACQKNSLVLIGFTIAVKFLEVLVTDITNYNLFQAGISKDTIVIIDTLLFPVTLSAVLLCHKLISRSYLMRLILLMNLAFVITVGISKLLLVLYINDGNDPQSWQVNIWLFSIYFFQAALPITPCFYAYFNKIADVNYGSTMLAIYMAVHQLIGIIPKTVGLAIAPHFDFKTLVLYCHAAELTIMAPLYHAAEYLDGLEPWDYTTSTTDVDQHLLRDSDNQYNNDQGLYISELEKLSPEEVVRRLQNKDHIHRTESESLPSIFNDKTQPIVVNHLYSSNKETDRVFNYNTQGKVVGLPSMNLKNV